MFVDSVFDFSPQDIEFFSTRLYAKAPSAQSLYGCSSLCGFLAVGEDLLTCCKKDRETLKGSGISYDMVADRLQDIFLAHVEGEKNTLIEGKFKVSFEGPTMCHQFCPFTRATDENASPFAPVKGTCGSGDVDITITNEVSKRSIKFSGLLVHLIRHHHFFEGNVPYRLDPKDVIETLELKPSDLQ